MAMDLASLDVSQGAFDELKTPKKAFQEITKT
jgi:hypothetical protein